MKYYSVHLAFREATKYSKKLRERNWQTKETLARGVNPLYKPLHTNGKEINGTKSNNKGLNSSFSLENGSFLPGWLQILLLAALNILLNNKSG